MNTTTIAGLLARIKFHLISVCVKRNIFHDEGHSTRPSTRKWTGVIAQLVQTFLSYIYSTVHQLSYSFINISCFLLSNGCDVFIRQFWGLLMTISLYLYLMAFVLLLSSLALGLLSVLYFTVIAPFVYLL